jgi:hypothetical protein
MYQVRWKATRGKESHALLRLRLRLRLLERLLLDAEADVQHVAVLDDVRLAFDALLPAAGGLGV